MNLNLHILYDELNSFSPQILTSKGVDLNLRQIRLLELPQDVLLQDCIYIFEAEEIEINLSMLKGIDFICIGTLAVDQKDYSGLSFISISAEYSKNTVFNAVQDIFNKYNLWEYHLMRNIAANESLQTIFDFAVSYLKNPAVIFDISSALIAKNSLMPDDLKGTVWETVIAKNFAPAELLPPEEQYLFMPENKTLLKKPIFIKGDYPNNQFSNMVIGIFLKNKLFATLCTMSICSAVTQGQVALFSYIRDVLEFVISSRTEFNSPITDVVYYIDMLIKGIAVDEKIIKYHLSVFGWHILDEFCIYNISASKEKNLTEEKIKFCLYRIKKLMEDLMVFSYENSIIIISRNSRSETNKAFEEYLMDLLKKLDMHCGRSLVFNSFSDLKYYYIQSKIALFEGDIHDPKKVLLDYQDYYFPGMIHTLDNTSSLKSLCHPSILLLYKHDSVSGTNYVYCLQRYIFNGCNIAQTAQDLYMHRNTLVYRLEKIADIIGIDTVHLDENVRMHLWLSCRISRYL